MNPRRRLLQFGFRAGLSLGASATLFPAWSKDNALTALPAPVSLQDSVAAALRQQNPLVVMVSLDGCPFCKTVRQSYLLPLLAEENLPVVQVDMRSDRPVLDFQGQASTHNQLIRGWKVRIAPTVLFLGAGGRELAPSLAGASLPDFYGAYLDQRLTAARQALKQS